MLQKNIFIFFVFFALCLNAFSQPKEDISIYFTKEEASALPGDVLNLAFFLSNNTPDSVTIIPNFVVPENWKIVMNASQQILEPGKKQLLIVTVQIAYDYPVGDYPVVVNAINKMNDKIMASSSMTVGVMEIENIVLELIEKPNYVQAGEDIKASYLIQNLGNTDKKVFIETSNCDVVGGTDIKLVPGETARVSIVKQTSIENFDSESGSYTVRARIADKVLKSVYSSTLIFPSKKAKKDLYFRFPVKASATYLSTNQQGTYESAYQFELEGSGFLDPQGKHRMHFLARGPNNTNLSFLGLYDQYYISYSNKNLELFAGEKSYTFTPLTESSRFGVGTDNKIILNNGLGFGFVYVKPRFIEDIEDEMAVYSDFMFNEKNSISLYYMSKKYRIHDEPAYLASISSKLTPFDRTYIEFELSRGLLNDEYSNAARLNFNTQFSVFHLSGNYYNAGENYPGYYTNSKFYSGNFSAKISTKLTVGIYAREDFTNAELDTFFVTAPYSKSMQAALDYNIASQAYLKFYWREYEKKDRLSLDKFHYKTNSFNLQFSHHLKRIDYDLTAEIGETTNYLLEPDENTQNSYRGSANITYSFNSRHSIRAFGTWSNINQFVSDDQRSVTAGLAATSRISKNLRAYFYIQNAYDIDDYYRNRNLMQLNVDYKFLKRHTLSLRSFYTIFKEEIDNAEFTLSATYSYHLGIPVKQVIKSGALKGAITNDNGEAKEGILVYILDKTAITNKNGEFEFKSISPGKHLFNIDRSMLNIDEISNITMPLTVDIIEDNQTDLNFKITKGAKLFGQIVIAQNDVSILDDNSIKPENIIIELKTNTEMYRITTDQEGRFSFPLVRPGNAVFRIYNNSVPKGYITEKWTYDFTLKSGEEKEVDITLSPKKRNIIFKSQNLVVSNNKSIKPIKVPTVSKVKSQSESYFYTVQIGAFRKKLSQDSKFLKDEQFYFEKQINNLHKYFVGKFDNTEDATTEKDRLKTRYKNAFIVVVQNNELINLKDFETNSEK